MDKNEISDIITAAESYVKKLKILDENIKGAESQITVSGNESLNAINSLFADLKKRVINVLDDRKLQLEKTIMELQENGIKPLRDCQTVISGKIAKTNALISQGNKILNNSSDNHENFYLESTLLGNLPAVPSLMEVPFIHFVYSQNAQKDIINLCEGLGSVLRHSPVQITTLTEKPGGILIEWEENEAVDDRLNNIQEFRLQFAFGDTLKNPQLPVNFNDCYTGPNTEYLKKDLKLNQAYSFRVSCRMEGCSEWNPWSLIQVGQTTLRPFSWAKMQQQFALNNDNKLATKTTNLPAILLSEGPQFQANHSIEFTILEMDPNYCNGIGLCEEEIVKRVNETNACDLNTFVVTCGGVLYIAGREKSTKLPHLKKGSKISFTCEEVSDKVRIYVESEEKNVTYDWKISPNENMYFFVFAESQNFKVLVE